MGNQRTRTGFMGGNPGAGSGAGGGVALAGSAAGAGSTGGAGGAGAAYNQATWLFPPSDYLNLDVGPQTAPPTGAVALPAIGGTATILSYKVSNGRFAKITTLGIDFVANGGAVFVQGILPPQLTFKILIDGRPVANYGAFNFLPGGISDPVSIIGFPVKENQTLTIVVTNNSIALTTQFLAARIQGFLFSKKLHPESAGYQS